MWTVEIYERKGSYSTTSSRDIRQRWDDSSCSTFVNANWGVNKHQFEQVIRPKSFSVFRGLHTGSLANHFRDQCPPLHEKLSPGPSGKMPCHLSFDKPLEQWVIALPLRIFASLLQFVLTKYLTITLPKSKPCRRHSTVKLLRTNGCSFGIPFEVQVELPFQL